MSQNPWPRSKSPDVTPSEEPKPPNHATAFFSNDLKNVTQVAETLAAHGGGALSGDLALDLVLNNLVEQARDVSGATGAAIALVRGGEMVCRATTGDNAPDLGMRVDTASGLAGDCLRTGELQQCRDTETEPRVNAEACRRLGVRSMLVAPIVDAGGVFGILQVFSAWPNSFGEREISALQALIPRIAESKREAEAGIPVAPPAAEPDTTSPPAAEQSVVADDRVNLFEADFLPVDEAQVSRGNEIWSAVLVILVICAAVLLGMVVGWRGLNKGGASGPPSNQTTAPAPVANSAENRASEQAPPAALPESSAPAQTAKAPAPPQPPVGGLLVTENGKVIYRTPQSGSAAAPPASAATAHSGTWLVHRVQPEYPPEAKAQNLQGPVVLDIEIHGDGTVGNINLASGNPILANAAEQAVKQWRYKPYFVDGHPVESQARITIRFTLPRD